MLGTALLGHGGISVDVTVGGRVLGRHTCGRERLFPQALVMKDMASLDLGESDG